MAEKGLTEMAARRRCELLATVATKAQSLLQNYIDGSLGLAATAGFSRKCCAAFIVRRRFS
jgi:hypothetical protein